MKIDLQERLMINGASQFVSICGETEGLPLLLYLHGGPGDAALPLVRKYNSALTKHFTVAIWEQRGAGKSYYPFAQDEALSLSTFVQDAHCLIEQLLKRFGQKKVILVGHSWGSVLGLLLCKQYPALIHTYIGCGQVINMQRSSRLAHEFAVQHSSGKTRERLMRIDPTYTGKQWLTDLLFTTKLVVKYGGSLYGANSYNRFVLDFICSKDYTLRDLLCREKGGLQSIKRLWQELMGISFEDTLAFEVPVIFIEGRHDHHVSSQLTSEYFETITTPKQLFWFEHSAHFPQWSEADKFHEILKNVLSQFN